MLFSFIFSFEDVFSFEVVFLFVVVLVFWSSLFLGLSSFQGRLLKSSFFVVQRANTSSIGVEFLYQILSSCAVQQCLTLLIQGDKQKQIHTQILTL